MFYLCLYQYRMCGSFVPLNLALKCEEHDTVRGIWLYKSRLMMQIHRTHVITHNDIDTDLGQILMC